MAMQRQTTAEMTSQEMKARPARARAENKVNVFVIHEKLNLEMKLRLLITHKGHKLNSQKLTLNKNG